MGRTMEPPLASITPSGGHHKIGPAPSGPPAEDAAPSPAPQWREAAQAAMVIAGTEVLLAAALAMGVRMLGR